jgi:putative SOS response-associated peptidase YedK
LPSATFLGELERSNIGAVITTDANELIAEIDDRMPLILAPRDYKRRLSNCAT